MAIKQRRTGLRACIEAKGGQFEHKLYRLVQNDRLNEFFTFCNKKAQLTHGLRAHLSKKAVSRHLGFYRTGNSAIRSPDPENTCLELNMDWIGAPFARYLSLNYTVTLKLGFGVIQGHRKRHH